MAVTVLATDVDAVTHDRPADDGNRYVTLRVRVENLTGVDGAIEASYRNFGLVTHPGEVIYVVDVYHVYQCGRIRDEIRRESSREAGPLRVTCASRFPSTRRRGSACSTPPA